MIALSDELAALLPPGDPFDAILGLEGDVFREHKNRRTVRVELGGRGWFVKVHGPIGWLEILKNLARGRLPTITAMPEVRAIRRLRAAGVNTMTTAGWGVRGRNPARRESFIVTEALEGMIDLRALIPVVLAMPPERAERLRHVIIDRMADMSRRMHEGGMNHRDFYTNHFLVRDRDWSRWSPSDPIELYLIDLHRAQIRKRTPKPWLAKDLSALLFSTLDALPTVREQFRFLRVYWGREWKTRLRDTDRLRRRVMRRAALLYRSEHGTRPPLPDADPSSA